MTHAIRIHAPGGPEALVWEAVELADPGPGEVQLVHRAIGLNYIDVYHRSGLYPLGDGPVTLGLEAAGVVSGLGDGVETLALGDRVAYASPPVGAYAEVRNMPAGRLVKLPEAIDDRTAAAMMLQGMTAQYLIRRTYPVQPGDAILMHAAAGGVGLILCQWAKHLGATVIGTAGSDEKIALAKAHGCDYVIPYREADVAMAVKELTDGAGVAVVYDGVGKDTFEGSLDSLRPLGMMVSFGQASGKIPPFDAGVLAAKGSLFLTRPTLMTYTADDADLQASAAEVIEVVAGGAVKIEVHQDYPLAEARRAHEDLEARRTTGSSVLIP